MSNEMLVVNAVDEMGALGTASRIGGGGGGGADHGIPSGGAQNQVLRKKTATDYDVEWAYSYAVLYTDQTLNDTAKGKARTNIGAAAAPTVTSDDLSTSVTLLKVNANTVLEFGELTDLTVVDFDSVGEFTIVFTSGSTPTVTDFPADLAFPEAFAAAANTRYEINVRNGYAVAVGWPVSAS